jgi:magnesium-transporting ATPase (P-type)
MQQENLPQQISYTVLPSSTLATISLIAGILGFTMLPVLGSIIAIWTGYEARKETRSVPPRASGDGLATAGIVMGWIQLALAVIGLCCFVVYFAFMLTAIGGSLNR